jgi:uncharacterized membrane protein YkgB
MKEIILLSTALFAEKSVQQEQQAGRPLPSNHPLMQFIHRFNVGERKQTAEEIGYSVVDQMPF